MSITAYFPDGTGKDMYSSQKGVFFGVLENGLNELIKKNPQSEKAYEDLMEMLTIDSDASGALFFDEMDRESLQTVIEALEIGVQVPHPLPPEWQQYFDEFIARLKA